MFLIINTANEKNYIAISTTDRIIGKISWPIHIHQSQKILRQIDKLLIRKKIKLQDLRAILVYQGPGSYTGLRVGISVANTLAFSLDIPVAGIKSEKIDFYPVNKNLTHSTSSGQELKIKNYNYIIPYYEN